MKKKRLISVVVAGGLAATGLAVTASMAQAWAPIPCSVLKNTGNACVIVRDDSLGHVHSVRVNGQCLKWSAQGRDHYYGNVIVPRDANAPRDVNSAPNPPVTQAYSGYNCEGNTEDSTAMFEAWADKAGKRTNFRRVDISPVPGAVGSGVAAR